MKKLELIAYARVVVLIFLFFYTQKATSAVKPKKSAELNKKNTRGGKASTASKKVNSATPKVSDDTKTIDQPTEQKNSENKTEEKEERPDTEEDKNFNKIRKFQSFDPKTNKWSTIEEFDTVDILENKSEEREDKFLYNQFWAYDERAKKWRLVDIRGHGYKILDPVIEPFQFWKNLSITFLIGYGPTHYTNNLDNLIITKRTNEIYLQSRLQEEKSEAIVHNWFEGEYEQRKNFYKVNYNSNRIEPISGTSYKGWGPVSIPFSFYIQYTFFGRLKLGGGAGMEASLVSQLVPSGDAAVFGPIELRGAKKTSMISKLIWSVRYFGSLAYNVFKRPTYDIVVDFQIGPIYDYGQKLAQSFKEGKSLRAGLFLGGGVSYERRLNDFFKVIARLAYDFKTYTDRKINDSYLTGSYLFKDPKSKIDMHQHTIHLDIGISFSFGRNKLDMSLQPEEELPVSNQKTKPSVKTKPNNGLIKKR